MKQKDTEKEMILITKGLLGSLKMAFEGMRLDERMWCLCLNWGGLFKKVFTTEDRQRNYAICMHIGIKTCPYIGKEIVRITVEKEGLTKDYNCSLCYKDEYPELIEGDKNGLVSRR
jgi:hypothetical protein